MAIKLYSSKIGSRLTNYYNVILYIQNDLNITDNEENICCIVPFFVQNINVNYFPVTVLYGRVWKQI